MELELWQQRLVVPLKIFKASLMDLVSKVCWLLLQYLLKCPLYPFWEKESKEQMSELTTVSPWIYLSSHCSHEFVKHRQEFPRPHGT